MKKRKRGFRLLTGILLAALSCAVLTSCGTEKKAKEKGKDWDYTVVAVRDCPEDFLKELEEKKINSFQMTYQDGESLYIALGYGAQATGGYSIVVHGLYELGDGLCLETELRGPGKDEVVKQKESYPYIIVKTEQTDREVVFDD